MSNWSAREQFMVKEFEKGTPPELIKSLADAHFPKLINPLPRPIMKVREANKVFCIHLHSGANCTVTEYDSTAEMEENLRDVKKSCESGGHEMEIVVMVAIEENGAVEALEF